MGWYPNDDFGLTLEPGIAASFWKIGQEKQHTVIPTMNASASWSPSKKVYLRGRLGLYMRPASPSESNPVLLQNSELMWSLGNPNLKKSDFLGHLHLLFLSGHEMAFAILWIGLRKDQERDHHHLQTGII